MSDAMTALAEWDNDARHLFGALVTAAGKVRDALNEHDACDAWMARTRDDPNISVKEGNEWELRDYAASAALGAAQEEVREALDAIVPKTRRTGMSEDAFLNRFLERDFGGADLVSLGHDHFLLWDVDGNGFLWHHPACKAWSTLRLQPDPASTGHRLVAREPLTVEGSLLCPMGCGDHGFIREGKWVVA